MKIDRTPTNSDTLKTAILDAERTHRTITFYTRSRRYIDRYRAIDTDNKPITLSEYVTHGGLIYYKKNTFDWVTISLDDVTAIDIVERSATA